MGLQATAATKRKHELTFDNKETNNSSYTSANSNSSTTSSTNCPPPLKQSRWSMNNNNYLDSLEEQTKFMPQSASKQQVNSSDDSTITSLVSKNNNNNNNNNINNNNNNNNDSKNCSSACNRLGSCTTSITNGNKEISPKSPTTNASVAIPNSCSSLTVNSLVTSLIPQVADLPPTTPLPPLSTTPVPEDSIAKLEVVAAVPCEPWTSNSSEPVDCISKLQAVAVPCDPWGSIGTRSTLATTLLSADELDDDDDDFEDDYEEEESIIPTYCPLRYHPFNSPTQTNPHPASRLSAYSPSHGYSSRPPNYYSEPFPQQNCSRAGNSQNSRMPNGFSQWHNSNTSNSHLFYNNGEISYPSQQQQTIRCAENGKSYLDLGCSTPTPTLNTTSPAVPSAPFSTMHVVTSNLDARHPLKRCCDARGTWCNTNKNCYRDIRLKIRNLSMFKLSRFRQVSEQSLYRSVLICNTLKRIDREIESETKEMHQAAAQAAQQHHQQYQQQQHQLPHHLQHHQNLHNPSHHSSQQQLQQQQHQQHLQQQHDYAPVMNCVRLTSLDYNHSHPAQQQHYQNQQQHQQQQQQHYQTERMDTSTSSYLTNSLSQGQKSSSSYSVNQNSLSHNAGSTTTLLHPYDHYPFRESQSGRATPFPNCQPINSAVTSNAPSPQSTQTQVTSTPATSNAAQTVISTTPTTVSSSAADSSSSAPLSTTTITCDSESSFNEDDSTRTINWSSVLSLSSQSALDPLNNNDLFSILPASTSVTNPATATPVPVPTSLPSSTSTTTLTPIETSSLSTSSVSISGTFTTVLTSTTTTNPSSSSDESPRASLNSSSSSATATFTTLTTIPATTYSLTSSYVSSMTSSHSSNSSNSPWEYGFLDMEFGLGAEFTELVPSCKLSSDELFSKGLTPVATSRYSSVHDNELEQPAHIMVGS